MILPDSRAHFRVSLRNQKRPCPIQDTVFFYQVSDQSSNAADRGSRASGLAEIPADLEAGLGSGLGYCLTELETIHAYFLLPPLPQQKLRVGFKIPFKKPFGILQ